MVGIANEKTLAPFHLPLARVQNTSGTYAVKARVVVMYAPARSLFVKIFYFTVGVIRLILLFFFFFVIRRWVSHLMSMLCRRTLNLEKVGHI